MNIIVNEQANKYLLDHIDSGMKGKQTEGNKAGFFYSKMEEAWISFDKALNIGVHQQMPSLNELGR